MQVLERVEETEDYQPALVEEELLTDIGGTFILVKVKFFIQYVHIKRIINL